MRARALPADEVGPGRGFGWQRKSIQTQRRTRRAGSALRTKALRILSLLLLPVERRGATGRRGTLLNGLPARNHKRNRAVRTCERSIRMPRHSMRGSPRLRPGELYFRGRFTPRIPGPSPQGNRWIPADRQGLWHARARAASTERYFSFPPEFHDRKKYLSFSLSLSVSLFSSMKFRRALRLHSDIGRRVARAAKFVSASEGARLRLTFPRRARGERVSGELMQGQSRVGHAVLCRVTRGRLLSESLRRLTRSSYQAYECSWNQVVQ
jgi:hypothetical protein